ncbi:hypothetical protein M758_4G169500 [Ceratodon purpureus]|nr:hypothetical protein M758_4G169500 [Ceratodon purpureus]
MVLFVWILSISVIIFSGEILCICDREICQWKSFFFSCLTVKFVSFCWNLRLLGGISPIAAITSFSGFCVLWLSVYELNWTRHVLQLFRFVEKISSG